MSRFKYVTRSKVLGVKLTEVPRQMLCPYAGYLISIMRKNDRGAQTNRMPLRGLSKLFPEHIDNGIPVGLQATPHKITGYCGVAIKQFGLCQLRITHIDGILPKGPYAWQIGPFWQDTLDISVDVMTTFFMPGAPGCTKLGLHAYIKLGLVTLYCEASCVNCHNDSDMSAITKQSPHADPNHPSYCPYGAQKPAKEDVMTREPPTFHYAKRTLVTYEEPTISHARWRRSEHLSSTLSSGCSTRKV